jgi:16S rRNA (uracil1498-N3)-methyltransferase
MESFYAPPERVTPPIITIEGEEHHHLVHVMRARQGDHVRVVDGKGTAYDAVVDRIAQHAAVCSIFASHPLQYEPSRILTLAVGILKNSSRFDYLVEKGVELGVRTIVPLLTERSVPKSARVTRWQKIAFAAMKQCGRCILPVISAATPFDDFILSVSPDTEKLIPHERADAGALRVIGRNVSVCIGPEGGFSDGEIDRATAAGFRPVSLGPRRLRTETAAVVAAAIVLL